MAKKTKNIGKYVVYGDKRLASIKDKDGTLYDEFDSTTLTASYADAFERAVEVALTMNMFDAGKRAENTRQMVVVQGFLGTNPAGKVLFVCDSMNQVHLELRARHGCKGYRELPLRTSDGSTVFAVSGVVTYRAIEVEHIARPEFFKKPS